jgi:hypothetical protein
MHREGKTSRPRPNAGRFRTARRAALLLLLATGCSPAKDDVGAVTRTSLDLLEEGRTKAAAGDFAGARDAFASATAIGGLQPDFFCAARLEQADCESRLGNHDAALALLDELATGAPDLTKIQELRAVIRDRSRAMRPAAERP